LVLALLMAFGAVSVVHAADRKRIRKHNGSCQSTISVDETLTLAASKDARRDRNHGLD
jgi:hypothetical protein